MPEKQRIYSQLPSLYIHQNLRKQNIVVVSMCARRVTLAFLDALPATGMLGGVGRGGVPR